MAFRTGLRSMEVRDVIEQSIQSALPAWSVIVGIEEGQALTELNTFSAARVIIPTTSKIHGFVNANRAIPELPGCT